LKKSLGLIILLSSLILVTGCNFNDEATVSIKDPQSTEKQSESTMPIAQEETSDEQDAVEGIGELSDKFAVKNLDDEWNELRAKVALSELIYYGDRIGSSIIEGNGTVEYSIRFPREWRLEDTIFYDKDNRKIAELSPVVLLKQDEEQSFLEVNIPKEESSNVVLLAKEGISFNNYKGTKAVMQINTDTTWCIYSYSITDRQYGITFTGYSYTSRPDKAEEQLFDKLIESFRFQ